MEISDQANYFILPSNIPWYLLLGQNCGNSHLKNLLEPFFSRTEEGTRARLFLTILGYTMIAIMAVKCNATYNQVLETISGIREVVYAKGSHARVEYTNEQRELMEKLKIEL